MASVLGIGTKIASALGLASIVLEGHQLGKIASRKTSGEVSADKFIKDEIGASKSNTGSPRHAATKDFIANCDILDNLYTVGAKIGGYAKGFLSCCWNNIFTVAFGMLGISAKSRAGKTIALIGLGTSMLYDFIVNGTNIFERKDYLEK